MNMAALLKWKEKILFFLVFCIVILGGLWKTTISVHAEEDNTPPVVTGVRILNPEVTKPGIVTIEISFIEEDTGVSEIQGSVDNFDYLIESRGNWTDSGAPNKIYSNFRIAGKTWYTGSVKVNARILGNARDGEWMVSYIRIVDNAGNENSYVFKWITDEYGSIADETGKYYGIDDSCWTNDGKYSFKTATFHVKNEFDIEFQASLSNPNLAKRLQEMPEGKVADVIVDPSSNGIVKKEVFDAIKGKDKKVIFDLDGIQWIFEGKDITRATKDIDIKTEFQTVSGSSYGADSKLIKVDFAPNGQLPGKAQIRMKSDYLYNKYGASGKIYLYYLNGSKLREEQSAGTELVFDGTDKWCYFTIDHNSTFLLTGEKLKQGQGSGTGSNGKAGLNKTRAQVAVSGSTQLKVTGAPGKVTWKSSDPSIATVSSKGKIKGRKVGKAVITAKAGARTYKCTVTVVPQKQRITYARNKKTKSVTLKWRKQSAARGYQIQYTTDKRFKKGVKSVYVSRNKTYNKTITKLKKGKTYYFKVRSYGSYRGNRYYGPYSSAVKVTVRK